LTLAEVMELIFGIFDLGMLTYLDSKEANQFNQHFFEGIG